MVHDITETRKSADALRESTSRFDLVRDGAEVGFWFCDLPFENLIWDKRVKEHFWLRPDAEVTIGTFYERLHPAERSIAQLLGESPGLRPEDVFVNIVEVAKENWSFGHGLAQYAQPT